jgi:hypothetical protein
MKQTVLTKEGESIFNKLKLFNGFYLAGGTGLALQLKHRQSIDFDLFSPKEIDKQLLSKVKKVFPDKKIKPTVNSRDELTVFVDNVKVTFLYYPYPFIYKPVVKNGLKILNLKELAAVKAYAIGRRGTLKDYVDLYFLIKKNIALKDIIKLCQKKYKENFNARLFLEQLIYFKDIEDIKIDFIKKAISKFALEKFFINQIKKSN